MVRFGPKLEKRQSVLFRVVDIGAELFAMAATCSRAKMLKPDPQAGPGAQDLADVFCRQARRRVEDSFDSLFDNDDVATYRVAQDVLEGRHGWLEEGVVDMSEQR
jgi:hypothetical protein